MQLRDDHLGVTTQNILILTDEAKKETKGKGIRSKRRA